ncbi:MAG: hypothetical protein CHACPFDD_01794 [Phycisphaerae bacterium]|nr:hypothetical protein [Phycisphaerae bacterium]
MLAAPLCLLLSGLALQADEKPSPPPMPDFKTRVDYAAWLAKQVRGADGPERNAAPLYEEIFKLGDSKKAVEELGFAGFRTTAQPGVRAAPWDAAEHQDWEAGYQKTRALVKSYREAAARPYVLFEDNVKQISDDPKACLVQFMLPHLPPIRACAKGALENAWRLENGAVPVDPFLLACEANLNVARQLSRDPFVISHLVAISIQAITYEDLRLALKHDVFSKAQRPRITRLLDRYANPLSHWRSMIEGELASLLDLLQVPEIPADLDAEGMFAKSRPSDEPGRKAAASALAAAAVRMIAFAELPAGHQKISELAAITNQHEIEFVRMFELSRAFALLRRGVAAQRGTRLLYEIFIYRDRNGHWPVSLNELPKAVLDNAGTDPISGERFVYRVEGDRFKLYSVAENGVDDGGQHDPKWGDGDSAVDFVFWPIPE